MFATRSQTWATTIRAAVAGTTGAIGALMLTACSGGVQLDGAKISGKVPFLSTIEENWRADVAKSHTSVSDSAHCWLIRSEKTKNLDRQAYCGPVRHLGAAAGGVWDVYSFATSTVDDEVNVSEIELEETGASLPTDREPYRPDGAGIPEGADQLAAPKPPPVEKGFAAVVQPTQRIEIQGSKQPRDGRVIAPDLELKVTEVGRTESLPGVGEAGIAGPAEGEELLIATIQMQSTRDKTWASRSKIDTTPVYSIQTSSGRKRLTFSGTGGTGGSSATSESGGSSAPITIAASVPTGSDAQLVVGVAGVDQTVSLRSGERTSKTAAGYYRSATSVDLNKQFPTTTFKLGEFEFQHGVTFTKAHVVPFLAEQGWAAAGKSWMQLDYDNASVDTDDIMFTYSRPNFDTAKTITLTDDTGRRIPYTGTLPTSENYSGAGAIAVEIPSTAKRITVTYAPAGTFSPNPDFNTDANPRNGSFKMRPLTFSIPVPAN